jgi:hypothetical protein
LGEVLQRIIWIDLLSNFGLFTVRQGLGVRKVLWIVGNCFVSHWNGVSGVYIQACDRCAADA